MKVIFLCPPPEKGPRRLWQVFMERNPGKGGGVEAIGTVILPWAWAGVPSRLIRPSHHCFPILQRRRCRSVSPLPGLGWAVLWELASHPGFPEPHGQEVLQRCFPGMHHTPKCTGPRHPQEPPSPPTCTSSQGLQKNSFLWSLLLPSWYLFCSRLQAARPLP